MQEKLQSEQHTDSLNGHLPPGQERHETGAATRQGVGYPLGHEEDARSLLRELAQPYPAGDDELTRRICEGVRRVAEEQLDAGYPIYYGGAGLDSGKLFMETPERRRYEYVVHPDGTHEIVREHTA